MFGLMKRLEGASRSIRELLFARGQGGLRDVRRFMAIGLVVALALLTAEMVFVYASAHPGYFGPSSGRTQDLAAPVSAETGDATKTAGAGTTTATTPSTAAPAIAATATPRGDFVSRVIARTNAYRVANGCAALTMNAILMGTAQGHSQEMALRDYVGHNSADGTSPWNRIKAAGYTYQLVAENIAWGATAPEEVVDAWFFESPPTDAHRKNILNCALREIGVGYYYLANDPGNVTAHSYWTQDFGTQAS
jgi:uncharacterized protein YkwD